MHEHMVTMDPPDAHPGAGPADAPADAEAAQGERGVHGRLADRQLDEFVAAGRCEFITAYSQPFAMLVVADVLGVPEADHQRFREGFGLSVVAGQGRRPDARAMAS